MSDQDAAESVYRTIHDLPTDDRPRERLLAHGSDILSAAELVAVVVASGTVGENAVDLARRLMTEIGGLPGLVRADATSLRRVKGLGPAKTAQLLAAIELGRRVQQIDPNDRPLLTTPEAVFGYMNNRLRDRPKEELHVLSLDTRGRLLGAAKVLDGGVSSVGVRPAEVFREPAVLHAVSVILVHNHPSGDPRPSPQDISVTRILEDAGALLEIKLLDHVIIGQNTYVSLNREGYGFGRKSPKVTSPSKSVSG